MKRNSLVFGLISGVIISTFMATFMATVGCSNDSAGGGTGNYKLKSYIKRVLQVQSWKKP